MVSETHFTSSSFIKIPQYTIYQTNHPDDRADEGTVIVIKTSVKHRIMNNFMKDYLQAGIVKINTSLGLITISSIYCLPKHIIKQEQFHEYFKTPGKKFISGGDFNAKHNSWGSRLITPRGNQLYNYIEKKKHAITVCLLANQHIGHPTWGKYLI